MEGLRKVPFVIALVSIVIALLLEIGATGVLRGTTADPSLFADRIRNTEAFREATQGQSPAQQDQYLRTLQESIAQRGRPPGLGIPYMALIDGILVFTVVMMALSFVLSDRVQAKLQGVVTLIFSLVLIIGGILLILIAFLLLTLMITLFFSAPFGTLAYLALFGFFDVGGAQVALSLLMALKIGFLVAMLVAHQGFLQNKGLVLLVATSLLANLIVGFLHGIVPFVVVSITDALGAIILGIIAVIWAIILLIGSIIAIVHAVATR